MDELEKNGRNVHSKVTEERKREKIKKDFLESSLHTNSHFSGVVLFRSYQCGKVLRHCSPGG